MNSSILNIVEYHNKEKISDDLAVAEQAITPETVRKGIQTILIWFRHYDYFNSETPRDISDRWSASRSLRELMQLNTSLNQVFQVIDNQFDFRPEISPEERFEIRRYVHQHARPFYFIKLPRKEMERLRMEREKSRLTHK